MSTIMRHCVGAGLLFCSLLGLWFVGVVPSFNMIIGIFLLLGFVATISYIKSSSVGKVAILFYTALILFVAINAIYSLIPGPIKEELGGIRRSETVKTAERLHQPGGETFQMIREQCKADFDKGLKDAGDRLHQSTSPEKTEELIQDIQKLEERRGKCSNAILALGEKGVAGKTSQATGLQDMYTSTKSQHSSRKKVQSSNDEMPVNLGADGPRLWNQYLCTKQTPTDTDSIKYETAINDCIKARE